MEALQRFYNLTKHEIMQYNINSWCHKRLESAIEDFVEEILSLICLILFQIINIIFTSMIHDHVANINFSNPFKLYKFFLSFLYLI